MKTLIFLHIVKTAGTTFRSLLLRKFPGEANYYLNTATNPQCIEEFKQLPGERKSKLGYVHAHMIPLGIHKYLLEATYITILRNPVDRVISEYFFISRNPDHPAHYAVKDLCFYDYVTKGILESQVKDNQTRIISGAGGTYQLNGYEKPLSRLDLQRAKENINNHYLLVGLFERFDETVVLLKRALGWRMWDIYYRRLNVGTNKPPMNEIATCTINIIERYNRLDFELYEYAKQLFEKRVAEQGASLGREVRVFRFCNNIYGRMANGKQRIYRLAHWFAQLRQIDFSRCTDHRTGKVRGESDAIGWR